MQFGFGIVGLHGRGDEGEEVALRSDAVGVGHAAHVNVVFPVYLVLRDDNLFIYANEGKF